jgi:hypothetical protein
MNKSNTVMRKKAIDAALGSVRAEGLNPSVKTQKRMQAYAAGKITASQLRSETINSMRPVSQR